MPGQMPVRRSCFPRSLNLPVKIACGVLSGAIVGLFASPAYPWASKGHEIVAAIAEPHLTDTARKRIKELLPQGTTLAEASTWPDKAGRQIPDMDPYHLEALAIVRAQVYRFPASGEITMDYTERAKPIIRTRLAQAGGRLASLLNEVLK